MDPNPTSHPVATGCDMLPTAQRGWRLIVTTGSRARRARREDLKVDMDIVLFLLSLSAMILKLAQP